MFEIKLVTLATLICIIGNCFVFSDGIPPYDLVRLVLKWHRSECCIVHPPNATEIDCSTCSEKQSISKWSIHGLWANDTSRRSNMSYCDDPVKEINFNTYPADLVTKMRQYWYVIRDSHRDEALWWQQWHKHGTCTRDISGMEEHQKYFEKTVELYESYPIEVMLSRGLVTTKGQYTRNKIAKTLKLTLKKLPSVTCDIRGGLSYLHGIQICFTKQFKVTDCNFRSKCAPPVYYP